MTSLLLAIATMPSPAWYPIVELNGNAPRHYEFKGEWGQIRCENTFTVTPTKADQTGLAYTVQFGEGPSQIGDTTGTWGYDKPMAIQVDESGCPVTSDFDVDGTPCFAFLVPAKKTPLTIGQTVTYDQGKFLHLKGSLHVDSIVNGIAKLSGTFELYGALRSGDKKPISPDSPAKMTIHSEVELADRHVKSQKVTISHLPETVTPGGEHLPRPDNTVEIKEISSNKEGGAIASGKR